VHTYLYKKIQNHRFKTSGLRNELNEQLQDISVVIYTVIIIVNIVFTTTDNDDDDDDAVCSEFKYMEVCVSITPEKSEK